MANPSDTGPSGVGTEVLRRSYKADLDNTEYKIIDGVANHIYTVLSITVCDQGVGTDTLWLKIHQGASSSAADIIFILRAQPIGNQETFIFNDKIILTDTDELIIYTSSATDSMDVLCTYIDQEFTT